MADTKEFDVEQIKGSQFMDRQDKQYFERHGAAMSGQAEALAEQYGIDIKEMNDTFDALMESLIHNGKEYIVNGAPLKCSMQAEEGTEQTLFYQGNEITSKPVLTADMSALQCGLLQGIDGWEQFGNLKKYAVISNIEQAKAACLNAPSGYGIGMMQWSFPTRKATLFQSYQKYQLDNGILSEEQLIKAEIDMMFVELTDEKNEYGKIIPKYDKYAQNSNTCDNITFSTCLLFRDYEAPETRRNVDGNSYCVIDGIWDNAEKANSGDDIPSICQRIIAAKVAYEEFAPK